jgi:hypothetical protein
MEETVDLLTSEVLAGIAQYKSTGDLAFAIDAFSKSTSALALTEAGQAEYIRALEAASQAFFTLFQATGEFAVIDGAAELLRRMADEDVDMSKRPARFTVQHDQWGETLVSRQIQDEWWYIFHEDGRVSYLSKKWSGWNGEGWPMGFSIQTPEGTIREFEEDHFGDGWRIVDLVLAKDIDNQP